MKSKKKELGQFFTDPILSDFMVKLTITKETKKMLDPAVGLGAFPNTAISYNPNLQITACEIDSTISEEFVSNKRYPCELLVTDYLSTSFDKKFDAIICNPPYNKFQQIENRKNYISDFKSKYNISLSGYSNLCVYFLIKSLNELNKGGLCCYIIPYEFFNTGYGVIIKDYILKSNMLKSVYRFDNSLNLFDDAITTSCILLFENKTHQEIEFVNILNIDELRSGRFENKKTYKYTNLIAEEKWLNYFNVSNDKTNYNNMVKLSTFGRVSRGIATGANSYFALNKSQINDNKLSDAVCYPCITKAPDVKNMVFTKEDFATLVNCNKKVFLFKGVNAITKEDYEYIKYGERIGVNKTYLTSHRHPWYSLENKDIAPIWICVFCRGKLKIIRNEAGINNLTTFHALYLYNNESDFSNIMFCYLLTPLAHEIFKASRREYGAGLTKFEPNDLNGAKMLDLRLLSGYDKNRILSIYSQIKKNNDESLVLKLDEIFRKYTMFPKSQKDIV
ncbi:MAG: N-6 DNA methylase [Eubacterium sp.]|nr:N-6 DNA methylase [Eubacterium sp.]